MAKQDRLDILAMRRQHLIERRSALQRDRVPGWRTALPGINRRLTELDKLERSMRTPAQRERLIP